MEKERTLIGSKTIYYDEKGLKYKKLVQDVNGIFKCILKYDEKGNVIHKTNINLPMVVNTTYEYDEKNRLIREKGESTNTELVFDYENDNLRYYAFSRGRCEERLNDDGQVLYRKNCFAESFYEYDERGNLISTEIHGLYPNQYDIENIQSINTSKKYKNEYDEKGNLISIESSYGVTVWYENTYNEEGKLVEVKIYSSDTNASISKGW